MRRRNSRTLLFLICILLLSWAWGEKPAYRHYFAFAPQSSSTAASTGQATSTDNPPQEPPSVNREGGSFVIKKEVDEVVVHATVVDKDQRMVTDLDRAAFKIFEDGKEQRLTSFRHEDIPVAMGIVIDNSGSMREKRDKVNKAALNLVRSSNPQDQVFVVNFNDEYFLDQDFTSDIGKLKEALEKVEARGGTALYDAIVASADQCKNSDLQKKVLFVVTDGEDTASRETLEQAVKRLQQENGPTIYTIGILGDEGNKHKARRVLQVISDRTGGLAFFPKGLNEVDAISREIAHDIRNQYTIGYKPTNPKSAGGFRTIRVEANAKGHGKLIVRTRSGYYAGQERIASGRP